MCKPCSEGRSWCSQAIETWLLTLLFSSEIHREANTKNFGIFYVTTKDLFATARVLLTMVTAYLLYLRKAVPPAPKQEIQLRVLRGVQQRLAALLASPRQQEDTPIWLTHQELHLLDEAMSGYVQLVRTLVPASVQRDETLREIERFHG